MITFFVLNDQNVPVPCHDLLTWSNATASRGPIKVTKFDDCDVSTVFLPLGFVREGCEPQLFETMIFGGEFNNKQWRCSTYDEALKQHAKACRIARP